MPRIRQTAARTEYAGIAQILYSYATPVAARHNGQTFRTSTWYSVTTTRHLNEWCRGRDTIEVSQDTIDKLARGGG